MTNKQQKKKNAYERERRRLHRLHQFEYAARERGLHVYRRHRRSRARAARRPGRCRLRRCGRAAASSGASTIRSKSDPSVRLELRSEMPQRRLWAIGVASVAEIDRLNIYWASVLAMERAIAALGRAPRVSDHRRGSHSLVRRAAGAADSRRRAVRGCGGGVDSCQGVSRRLAGRHSTVKIRDTGSRSTRATRRPLHIEALRVHGPERPPSPGWARVRGAARLLFGQDPDAVDIGLSSSTTEGAARARRGRSLPRARKATASWPETCTCPGGNRPRLPRCGDPGRGGGQAARSVPSFGSALAGGRCTKTRDATTDRRGLRADRRPNAKIRFDVVTLDGNRLAVHRNAF